MGIFSYMLTQGAINQAEQNFEEKIEELTEKYAAAMGKIAELEEMLRIERASRLGERSEAW